jgi:hypothetical protein
MKYFAAGIGLILFVLSLLVFILAAAGVVTAEIYNPAVLGILTALLFVSSGFLSFTAALKQRQKVFNKVVAISIFMRLILMSAGLVSIFKFSDINRLPFLIGMFVGFFLFQMWELISFNKLKLERA